MASITSVTQYGNDRPWTNGKVRRRYTVVLTDNDGVQHERVLGPFKVDPADDGIVKAQEWLDSLAAEEANQVEEGDALSIIQNPKWTTGKDAAKKAIRYMMRENDPRIVIALEPLITHLRANYTGAQLITFLDITAEQGQKLNRRIDAILTDSVGTAKDLIAAFEVEQEDIA